MSQLYMFAYTWLVCDLSHSACNAETKMSCMYYSYKNYNVRHSYVYVRLTVVIMYIIVSLDLKSIKSAWLLLYVLLTSLLCGSCLTELAPVTVSVKTVLIGTTTEIKPVPIMLFILPIIPSRISHNFYPLFFFYSHAITYYSCYIL